VSFFNLLGVFLVKTAALIEQIEHSVELARSGVTYRYQVYVPADYGVVTS
jgi:hypothetical protein